MPDVLLQRCKAINIILLGIILAGFAAACGKADDSAVQRSLQEENVLRYDVNAPFTSLNPTIIKFSGSNHIFPLLYSYLFVPNARGKLEPDLATRWAFDSDKLEWHIDLRSDAVFHNKRPVTSKDVKYSYETWIKNLRPELDSVINRISLLSDTALCIHLKREDSLILQKMWDFEIIPHPGGGEIDFYHLPIGSGPFKFRYRENNKLIILEANHDYYNDRPSLDKIVFYYQPDKEKAWTRLLAGKTDIAQEISPKNYQMLKQYKDRFYFDHYTLRFYAILLYNTYDPLFSDPAVRRALTHAIDREHIVKEILNGYGKVAHGPMGVDSPLHNREVNPLSYDPPKALALLKAAGWSHDGKGRFLYKEGKPFEFTLLVYKESQIEKKVARYIQLCLNDLGIKVHLHALPFGEVKRRYFGNTEFQAVLTEIDGAYRNPEFLKSLWTSGASRKSEAGCFEHPEVTRLIKKGLEERDPVKRNEFFYKVDALIASLQPGTFLFHKTAIDAMSRRFNLPFPFNLEHPGIYRLRHAVLNRN